MDKAKKIEKKKKIKFNVKKPTMATAPTKKKFNVVKKKTEIKNKDLYLFSMNKKPFNYRKSMREDEPEKYKMIMKYSKENPEVYKKRTTQLKKEVESKLGKMKTFGEVLNEL